MKGKAAKGDEKSDVVCLLEMMNGFSGMKVEE